MKSKNRQELEYTYGPEIVVSCCRKWKTHYGDGRFGRCGNCNKNPVLTDLTWEQLDEGISDDR